MLHSLPSRRSLAIISNVHPRCSPTVRANESARQKGLPPPAPPEKWPMRFLEHGVAHNHWLAPVTLKEVTAILDDFDALGLAMAKMQAKTICSANGLLAVNDVKYRDIATTLLICGLDSGDPVAINYAVERLLNDAVLAGRHRGPGVATARKINQEHAKNGKGVSVFLEGKLLEYEGKSFEALQLYQTWSHIKTEYRKNPNFSGDTWDTPECGDICKALARLRANLGDRTGAEEAIRDAAFVYDDPAAYYHLAIEFVAPGSHDFEMYLLKAASSDHSKSSHELGMFYFNQSRQGIPLQEPKDNETFQNTGPLRNSRKPLAPRVEQPLSRELMLGKRAEAIEWFNIGAESGITASQVYLALLLRDAGRAEEGLIWLQKATKYSDAEDWTEAVDYFRRIWRLSAPDPMLMNIESLRKSNKNRTKKDGSKLASLTDATWMTDMFLHLKKIDGG
ncbi:MAG: hypothetical protein LQ339_000877 [Xanthoria mediterranea]|nr:MAG: hypothetical protein LQ339_000877 [Xanthoria mediterranea]